jgi:hypothetical protein
MNKEFVKETLEIINGKLGDIIGDFEREGRFYSLNHFEKQSEELIRKARRAIDEAASYLMSED